MNLFDRAREAARLCRAAINLLHLPRARLEFKISISPKKIRAMYALFTRPHARFPMIGNKTLGIALVDLSKFNKPDDYLATVKKKDYAGHQSQLAKRRGYTMRIIDRNDFIEDIYGINISAETRQGRPMDAPYHERQTSYDIGPPFECFGIFNADDRLVAYCNVGVYGNFASTDKVLGYKNNDGVMLFLFTEIICRLITENKLKYFMYDTYIGALPGLKDFKRRIGFAPYWARYSIG